MVGAGSGMEGLEGNGGGWKGLQTVWKGLEREWKGAEVECEVGVSEEGRMRVNTCYYYRFIRVMANSSIAGIVLLRLSLLSLSLS